MKELTVVSLQFTIALHLQDHPRSTIFYVWLAPPPFKMPPYKIPDYVPVSMSLTQSMLVCWLSLTRLTREFEFDIRPVIWLLFGLFPLQRNVMFTSINIVIVVRGKIMKWTHNFVFSLFVVSIAFVVIFFHSACFIWFRWITTLYKSCFVSMFTALLFFGLVYKLDMYGFFPNQPTLQSFTKILRLHRFSAPSPDKAMLWV